MGTNLVLQLDAKSGEGNVVFPLGNADAVFNTKLTTRYNYTTKTWVMDVSDINDNLLTAGIALIPGYDLLKRFPDVRALVGGLVIIEATTGYYEDPTKLGSEVLLLWYPVGTEVVIPS